MNPDELRELRELVEFLKENKIGEFDLERGDLKVRLKFAAEPGAASGAAANASALDMAQLGLLLAASQPSGALAAASQGSPREESAAAAAVDEEAALHTVKSPIVGTFYEAASPGTPPFVKPGDHVEVGQVLGIIEAMKLMNEIESDMAGEVVRRIAGNGQPVEYGQVLFLIKPR